MKIAIFTALYRDALTWFYRTHDTIAEMSFEEHKHAVDNHVSLWAAAWQRALSKQGFDVLTFPLNDSALLRSWARANDVVATSPEAVMIELTRRFKPEILWYDSVNAHLLRAFKEVVPSLRLVLCWSGSAIIAYDVFRESDVVLSCAPETVTKLTLDGFRVYQMHHAFDRQWAESIKSKKRVYDVTFVGQLVRGAAFHTERERLLKRIAEKIDLSLFSPTYDMGTRDILRTFAIQAAYAAVLPLKKLGLSSFIAGYDGLRKVLDLTTFPRLPYDRTLKRIARPPVFGTEMLARLKESQIVLNIHADTSPRFASNMRLFESTGVGSLLLTEQRQNISELFLPGEEIVTYDGVDDCLQKVQWLISHREECAAIAQRGMNRVLNDHSFDQRAGIFCEIVEKHLHG